MKKFNVAVVGATGIVGRTMLRVLEERRFPVETLKLLASARSAGQELSWNGGRFTVQEISEEAFKDVDIAIMSAGGQTSLQYAKTAAAVGCVVIDNSSVWRMDAEVPLVVPEVNPEDIWKNKGIIANPNCSTIQSVVALAPLHARFGLKRVVYSTYQAVSGAGVGGIKDLENGLKGLPPEKFPHPIAGNVIPQIDVFGPNGYTGEEMKMMNETRKIFHAPYLKVTATTVRVPVHTGHSVAINVEFDRAFDLKEVYSLLRAAQGIVVVDDISKNQYPMPLMASGTDDVYVGRIRRDESAENGLCLWVVADNVRKGAATNAVQIAEMLIQERSAFGG